MTLSLSEFARRCREEQVPGFLNLRKLLGSDLEAAKALRAETAFVQSAEFVALEAPRNETFALQVRMRLIEAKQEWTSETLLAACLSVMAEEKQLS